MPIPAQYTNKPLTRSSMHWGLCLLSLALIAPLSLALAASPVPTNGEQSLAPVQTTIDPVSGLVYGTPSSVNGIAIAVDADGHPRAFCADPADSLAPSRMRDAMEPATSRLRYE